MGGGEGEGGRGGRVRVGGGVGGFWLFHNKIYVITPSALKYFYDSPH